MVGVTPDDRRADVRTARRERDLCGRVDEAAIVTRQIEVGGKVEGAEREALYTARRYDRVDVLKKGSGSTKIRTSKGKS